MPGLPDNVPAIDVPVEELGRLLKDLCPGVGIDLAGAVALPCTLPHRERWLDWVAEGRHGQLDYLVRNPEARADPAAAHPWARSVLVFAQRYSDGWPAQDPDPSACGYAKDQVPWLRRVARYARGADYHDVLLADIKSVTAGLTAELPGLLVRTAVDTGPYLERELAWLAGLGFLGKNTCLIHERLGSGIFLGVSLTNMRIQGMGPGGQPPGQPLHGVVARPRRLAEDGPLSLCGKCTRCRDACPTGALLPDGGLDAGRCLSTWTIEWRGRTPPADRPAQDGILFGCDICQAVCPWNHTAARRRLSADSPGSVKPDYDEFPAHAQLRLADLLELTEQDFHSRFRRTPLWRGHLAGLRRNALVVAGNLSRADLSNLADLADTAARIAAEDDDGLTREVAAWCSRNIEEGIP